MDHDHKASEVRLDLHRLLFPPSLFRNPSAALPKSPPGTPTKCARAPVSMTFLPRQMWSCPGQDSEGMRRVVFEMVEVALGHHSGLSSWDQEERINITRDQQISVDLDVDSLQCRSAKPTSTSILQEATGASSWLQQGSRPRHV